MEKSSYHWLDVERIGEELAEAHPSIDPQSVTFPRLRELVEQLQGFEAQPGHPCNERILESIQQAWIEEVEGSDWPAVDDDE